MIKSWLNLCLAILTAGSFYGQQAAQGILVSSEPTPGPDALSGSYSIVVDSYDWGAGVSKAILTLEQPVSKVSPEQFQVVEEKQARENSSVDMFANQGSLTITRSPRTVAAAYLSDETGKSVKDASKYVTLELTVAPNVGSPLCFHPDEQHYRWANPYQLVIDLTPGSTISSGETQYTRLAIARTPTNRSLSLADQFTKGRFSGVEHTFSYASYAPAADGEKHPLVIWLHGLGEGGTDPTLPLLGSEADFFADPQFQGLIGGAYVLMPQCPTFWLDDSTGRTTQTGESCYTSDLMSLIQYYLYTTPGVDRDRIYIGGCSNGGYMTMELLLTYPDFFAAAFPVCQAYQDRWITDEQIQQLKDTPIWFVHSELDQVCPPSQSTFPTVERLLAAGSTNVRLSRLQEIYDMTGKYRDEQQLPYRYNPHYAWVPVLNDEITDSQSKQDLFFWLGLQSLIH